MKFIKENSFLILLFIAIVYLVMGVDLLRENHGAAPVSFVLSICLFIAAFWVKKHPTKADNVVDVAKESTKQAFDNIKYKVAAQSDTCTNVALRKIATEVSKNISFLTVNPMEMDLLTILDKYTTSDLCHCPDGYRMHDYLAGELDCILLKTPATNIALSDVKIKRRSLSEMPNYKYKSISTKTRLSTLRDFVVMDVETTGLKTTGNDIIEVAAIKFIDFKPACIFTSLLKPRKPIPEEATAVNHITNDMVAEKPYFYQIVPALQYFVGELPIVGHNLEFDIKHLFVNGLELSEKVPLYDTLELSRKYVRNYENEKLENYKLSTVCSELDICFNDSHRASADALATGLMFVQILLLSHDVNNIDEYI